jgi:hypothetical protein
LPPLTVRIGSDSMATMSGSILTLADRAYLLRMMRSPSASLAARVKLARKAFLLLDCGYNQYGGGTMTKLDLDETTHDAIWYSVSEERLLSRCAENRLTDSIIRT